MPYVSSCSPFLYNSESGADPERLSTTMYHRVKVLVQQHEGEQLSQHQQQQQEEEKEAQPSAEEPSSTGKSQMVLHHSLACSMAATGAQATHMRASSSAGMTRQAAEVCAKCSRSSKCMYSALQLLACVAA